MKSAYELAMERLAEVDPKFGSVTLTGDQKEHLADIDALFDARIAENEIMCRQKLCAAETVSEAEEIREQVRVKRQCLNEEREERKEQVRNGELQSA